MNLRKHYLAKVVDDYVSGRSTRRQFLRNASLLGLAVGGAAALSRRPVLFPTAHAAAGEPQDAGITAWLKEAGKHFRGKDITIKYSTEATPPSQVLSTLVADDFTAHTGINVEVEIVPLEQVLQKLTQDVAGGLGSYDLYYLDQSWMATFSQDTVDPRELYNSKPDFAMPNYDFSDFLPALTEGISMYKDKLVGVPFDIPIFFVMYRMDIYEELGLQAPRTFEDYMSNAAAISEAKGPQMYGTTGQMKSGHYSLECDWTNWLWGNGGSIFGPDGKFSGNDDRGIAAMDYWIKLKKYMPPDVVNWTWDGEFTSIAQGIAGQVYSWGEFFPGFDNPAASEVSGLIQPSMPLKPIAMREPGQAGHGEIPGTAHQGGSALAVSKYSKNLEAAWLFAQWGSSSDMNIRVSLLGGGASPMRTSTYESPRIKAKAVPGAGTTRHYDVTRASIENFMGSEPDHPGWAECSNGPIPVELGRFFAGEYSSPKKAMDAIAKEVDDIFEQFS